MAKSIASRTLPQAAHEQALSELELESELARELETYQRQILDLMNEFRARQAQLRREHLQRMREIQGS